jgi:hypothetical protein
MGGHNRGPAVVMVQEMMAATGLGFEPGDWISRAGLV